MHSFPTPKLPKLEAYQFSDFVEFVAASHPKFQSLSGIVRAGRLINGARHEDGIVRWADDDAKIMQDICAEEDPEKALQPPTKLTATMTEEDGKEAAAKGTGSVTALGGAPRASAAEEGAPSDAQRTAWKQRADAARAAITGAEARLQELEKAINVARGDQTPLTAEEAQDPLRLQKKEAKIFQLNKDLEAQKVAVDAAKKAFIALEDEARKAGVPPGWLR